MRYIPNTRKIREEMLDSVGLGGPDDLFAVIPETLRLKRSLDLPPALDEPGLGRLMRGLTERDGGSRGTTCIMGGGAYHHHVPSAVSHLVSRSEFLTAYTPYQPEISQGTLQAIFEYQTMMCGITGMDVSNASLYDGASATAEAVLMARRITGRETVVVSRAMNPHYRQVIATYLGGGAGIREVGWDENGRTDTRALEEASDDECACFVVQNPNVFGVVEDGPALAGIRSRTKALLVAGVTEALSLGMLSPPGEWAADIVAAEGQSLGNPLGFGGPYLGILAARESYLRQMPGRLVGQTVDTRGERGYVLTLATREQHIRRERATSNICSNEGLCALAATVHLSLLGPSGFRNLSARNVIAARRALEGLRERGGWSFPFGGDVFNEFVAVPEAGVEAVQKALREAGFTGGIELGRWYPELEGALLFCFTETVGDEGLERFLAAAGGAS